MNKIEFGIYSITNIITGDMYIGQTYQNAGFKGRWRDHRRELNKNIHNNKHLQSAWNKYGEEAFEFNVVHLCDELDDLNVLEKYYIEKYNTYKDGYNLTMGGDGFVYDEDDLLRRRQEQSKISKEMMRNKSNYSIKQIENVKILLCEPTDLLIKNRIKEISKLTSVTEKAILSIKHLRSWVDIREDLNEIMVKKNDEKDKKRIIYLFQNKKVTITQLANMFNTSNTAITYFFKNNKITYSETNKLNKQYQQNKKVIKYYNKGIRTLKNFNILTGYSDYIVHRALDENGTSIRREKLKEKTRVNKEKSCNIKGVNWDIKTKKWFLRITYNKEQIPIGKFDTVKDANDVKKELDELIIKDDYEGIMNIKQKYTKAGEYNKKIIKCTNIETKEELIIEGIGVASRQLNISRRAIEKVLCGYYKTTHGYIFKYVKELGQAV